MPKVTVCVPVFGVEQYIERCARSLFEQSLDDMEFVFVDDCTKDNSIDVLEQVIEDYPHRKGQIKILHHKINKGLSFARETGVKAASGEYIAHCDSDDWVDPTMYEMLYKEAIDKGLDFVRCDYRKVDGIVDFGEVHTYTKGDLCNKQQIISWLIADRGWNSLWCTLVSRKVYSDNMIFYTPNSMLEDMVVVLQLITYSAHIGVVNDVYYNYYYNHNSISKDKSFSSLINRAKSAYDNICWMLGFISGFYDLNLMENESVVLKSIPRRIIIPTLCDKSNYKIWDSYFSDVALKPFFSRYLSNTVRYQYLLAFLHIYPLYSRLKR